MLFLLFKINKKLANKKYNFTRRLYFMSQLRNINVKLRSYNSSLLDKATASFISSVKNVGGNICGPIPMPRKIEKFTVTRSPHVDKKSMEKFVKITYTRLVRILGVTPAIIEELSKIEIQAGVGVEISVTN